MRGDLYRTQNNIFEGGTKTNDLYQVNYDTDDPGSNLGAGVFFNNFKCKTLIKREEAGNNSTQIMIIVCQLVD